jgi:long-subunit acyl-CoA synthetase (AMP-forming)
MARMLLDDPATRAGLGGLAHLLIGGEATSPELARELREIVRGRFTNMYGPTETTIWSTTWEFPDAVDAVSIGKPIANTSVYVLDRWRRPLPTGVPGELWIGGDGVVRGYHGRPDLTSERFVADPFRPGHRMYKTGDLAFLHPDGELGFLGRNDHQVKLRGHRIELGEIESALLDAAGVRQAVALARADGPGGEQLVAYVVAGADAFDEGRLRSALRSRLPEYMVPARVLRLDALPHTPNGKLDRAALPGPEALQARPTPHAPPAGELEAQLAELWGNVLGRTDLGRDDNFFALGGHSLLVVKLHRDLVAALDLPLSLTDLYRFPTIRGLADFLTTGGDTQAVERSSRRGASRRSALAARGRRAKRPNL